MKIYTVYAKTDNSQTKYIPEDWSLLALILPILWALYHRIWWLAGLCLMLNISFGQFVKYNIFTTNNILFIQLATQIIISIFASEILRFEAKRQGLVFADIIAAQNEDEAFLRYMAYNENN